MAEEARKLSFADRLERFIEANAKLIVVFVGAAIVGGVGYQVYSSQKQKAELESFANFFPLEKPKSVIMYSLFRGISKSAHL